MKTSRILLFALPAFMFLSCGGNKGEMDRYVDSLMSKMTLEEKIGQLNLPVTGEIVTGQAQSSDVASRIRAGEVGGLFNLKGAARIREVQRIAVEESRLGIPLIMGMDVIHGYETVFPIPLGLSCSWDMDAIERSAAIAAREAGADGISWTFSPMVDIARDPRWGRVSEGSGEDPYLGSEIARAMVRGYQGGPNVDNIEGNDHIMACVKHFALYGAAEGGLDYNTVDMSRQRMYNDYLPPYRAAVEEGAGSIMVSFNEIDGVPATANKWLVDDLLRRDWGFGGFVVTDYTGIYEMTVHGIGDLKEVSRRALDAGVDMDMVSEGFLGTVKASIEEGKLSVSQVDRACRRILEAKYKLGLFKDPYKYCSDTTLASKVVYCPEHRAEARKTAAESFVLLKNDAVKGAPVLPLKKSGTIALVGPLANTGSNMPGTWSVAARHGEAPSLLDGLREVVGDKVNILYAKGSNLCGDAVFESRATMFGRTIGHDERPAQSMIAEALAVARRADVVVAALGEASEMSGESSSLTDISIPEVQRDLLKALLSVGKPVVLVLFNGRPLTIEWEKENVPAILDVWFGGSEAAYAIADVLFGDVNPSGKLTMSFPKAVGQIPVYYAHKNTGRALGDTPWFEKFRTNYMDIDNNPAFPFGYGLSYTSFEYSPVELSSDTLPWDGKIEARVKLTNTGETDGKEVVQLYIRDLVGSVTRPVRELKGFRKVAVKAGETVDVCFDITREMLEFYGYDLQKAAEPGDFKLFIGGDSTTSNEASFTLVK